MPAGKRTETRHLLRDIREQAATLAKANPQGWADKARRVDTLNKLRRTTSDLRFRAAAQDKDAAWDLHKAIATQWYEAWHTVTEAVHAAGRLIGAGDRYGLEVVVPFLEADPYFYRSGYLKEWLLPRVIRLVPFPDATAARLRQVVLNRVRGFWGREFPCYKRLAKAVDSPELRDGLQKLAADADPEVQARALSVLRHLNGDPRLKCRRTGTDLRWYPHQRP